MKGRSWTRRTCGLKREQRRWSRRRVARDSSPRRATMVLAQRAPALVGPEAVTNVVDRPRRWKKTARSRGPQVHVMQAARALGDAEETVTVGTVRRAGCAGHRGQLSNTAATATTKRLRAPKQETPGNSWGPAALGRIHPAPLAWLHHPQPLFSRSRALAAAARASRRPPRVRGEQQEEAKRHKREGPGLGRGLGRPET